MFSNIAKKWRIILSWKFTDESSIKYLWIRKWTRWIRPLSIVTYYSNSCYICIAAALSLYSMVHKTIVFLLISKKSETILCKLCMGDKLLVFLMENPQQKTTVECEVPIAGWLLIFRKCLSELLGPACGRSAISSSSDRHFLKMRSQPAIQRVHSTVVFCCGF